MAELPRALVHSVLVSPVFACFSTAACGGLECSATRQLQPPHERDLPGGRDTAAPSRSGDSVLLIWRQLL